MSIIDLGQITQGERGTLTFTWLFPDNITTPATIAGATITAVMKNANTGDVTAVTGTLTGTGATTATWAVSETDSGTPGLFYVVFRAVVVGVATYTLPAQLVVEDNPAVNTVSGPALVGVSTDEAAWLAASEAGGALGTAAYQPTTAFDAAGAASAAQANAIAASVPRTGGTMTGLLQFSGIGHAGLKLNALTVYQRNALAAAAGMVVFNSDAGEPCYHDGIVWRQFSDNAIALPLEFDFTAMSDGFLPSVFTGTTWAISTGKAINTPTLGAELLTDPGLEGTYTAGKANALTKTGLPTLTESADAHGGSKAQEFTGAAITNAVYWAAVAGVAGREARGGCAQ